jgi:hypothetical protein
LTAFNFDIYAPEVLMMALLSASSQGKVQDLQEGNSDPAGVHSRTGCRELGRSL